MKQMSSISVLNKLTKLELTYNFRMKPIFQSPNEVKLYLSLFYYWMNLIYYNMQLTI